MTQLDGFGLFSTMTGRERLKMSPYEEPRVKAVLYR